MKTARTDGLDYTAQTSASTVIYTTPLLFKFTFYKIIFHVDCRINPTTLLIDSRIPKNTSSETSRSLGWSWINPHNGDTRD